MPNRWWLFLAGLVASCTGACGSEGCEGAQQAPSAPAATASGGAVVETADIDRYVAALAGVRSVQVALEHALEDVAGSPRKERLLRSSAARQKRRAIERTGMSEEDFDRMTRMLEEDPRLRAVVQRRLQGNGPAGPVP